VGARRHGAGEGRPELKPANALALGELFKKKDHYHFHRLSYSSSGSAPGGRWTMAAPASFLLESAGGPCRRRMSSAKGAQVSAMDLGSAAPQKIRSPVPRGRLRQQGDT